MASLVDRRGGPRRSACRAAARPASRNISSWDAPRRRLRRRAAKGASATAVSPRPPRRCAHRRREAGPAPRRRPWRSRRCAARLHGAAAARTRRRDADLVASVKPMAVVKTSKKPRAATTRSPPRLRQTKLPAAPGSRPASPRPGRRAQEPPIVPQLRICGVPRAARCVAHERVAGRDERMSGDGGVRGAGADAQLPSTSRSHRGLDAPMSMAMSCASGTHERQEAEAPARPASPSREASNHNACRGRPVARSRSRRDHPGLHLPRARTESGIRARTTVADTGREGPPRASAGGPGGTSAGAAMPGTGPSSVRQRWAVPLRRQRLSRPFVAQAGPQRTTPSRIGRRRRPAVGVSGTLPRRASSRRSLAPGRRSGAGRGDQSSKSAKRDGGRAVYVTCGRAPRLEQEEPAAGSDTRGWPWIGGQKGSMVEAGWAPMRRPGGRAAASGRR